MIPPIGPINPNMFQNPQKLEEYLRLVQLPDVVRRFYEEKMSELCDDDYYVENVAILKRNRLPFATYDYVIREGAKMMISLPVYKGRTGSQLFGYAETTVKEIRQGTKYHFKFELERGTMYFSVKDDKGREVCGRKRLLRSSWSVGCNKQRTIIIHANSSPPQSAEWI